MTNNLVVRYTSFTVTRNLYIYKDLTNRYINITVTWDLAFGTWWSRLQVKKG